LVKIINYYNNHYTGFPQTSVSSQTLWPYIGYRTFWTTSAYENRW